MDEHEQNPIFNVKSEELNKGQIDEGIYGQERGRAILRRLTTEKKIQLWTKIRPRKRGRQPYRWKIVYPSSLAMMEKYKKGSLPMGQNYKEGRALRDYSSGHTPDGDPFGKTIGFS